MKTITVTQLHIYPVKSLSGIALHTSELDKMGLKYDRRWMVVSPDGLFMSQRKLPQMALIRTRLENDETGHSTHLILSKDGMPDFIVPACSARNSTMKVTVWDDQVEALRVGETSDAWLSEAIGRACHLVYIPEDEIRQCDLDYAKKGDRTGFADGFPLLLISQASLDDLNARLRLKTQEPVKMRRFRPNIVVTGCDAYAEDQWDRFTLGEISMRGVKTCSRCIMTTVDPDKGERTGSEPLATLMSYRKQGNKVLFGMNVIHDSPGILRVGDKVITE